METSLALIATLFYMIMPVLGGIGVFWIVRPFLRSPSW